MQRFKTAMWNIIGFVIFFFLFFGLGAAILGWLCDKIRGEWKAEKLAEVELITKERS